MPGNMKPEQMMRAYVDNKIAPIDATLDDHASQLADTADNTALWRAKDGNPATCYPVPKSRLYPRVELVATQEGSGDPSPENVRSIVASMQIGNVLRVTVGDGADENHTYDLLTAEQDFYGLPGAPVVVDAEAVTVQDAVVVQTGAEPSWFLSATATAGKSRWAVNALSNPLRPANNDTVGNLRSNMYPPVSATIGGTYQTVEGVAIHATEGRLYIYDEAHAGDTLAQWKAHVAALYAAGNPITVQYQLETPTVTPFDAPAIAALERLKRTEARQNVLTVTANDSTVGVQKQTVTYAKSPIRESDELAAAIAALD